MNFITNRENCEAVNYALSLIPKPIQASLGCDWILGDVPKILIGEERSADGRLYSETPHVLYEFHQENLPLYRRRTTIVLPRKVGYRTVVHEIGHVVHRHGWWTGFAPTCDYAKTDFMEAFACAFEGFFAPGRPGTKPIRNEEYLWFEKLSKIGPLEMN